MKKRITATVIILSLCIQHFAAFAITEMTEKQFEITAVESMTETESENEITMEEDTQPAETDEAEIFVGWEFNQDANTEGWSGNLRMDPNVTVSNGVISFCSLGSADGREPSIYSPICSNDMQQGISLNTYNAVKIRLKNQTDASNLYFYYTTYNEGDTNLNSNKRVTLPVTISEDFVEYTVDFRKEEKWSGLFKQFMITMGGAGGTLSIDYVRFVYEDYGWKFDDNTVQGWLGNERISAVSAANGVLMADSVGNGNNHEPALYSSSDMPVKMDDYHKVKIRLKNQTDADILYFYYKEKSGDNAFFDSSRRVSVPVEAQCDEFREYVISFYNESQWIGIFGQFMITMGGAEGHLELDEVVILPMPKTDYAHWDFHDNSSEGWYVTDEGTGEALHELSVEDDCLKIVRKSQGVGAVFTPDGLGLPEYCRYLVLGVKRASNAPSICAYFKTTAGNYAENDMENRITHMRKLEIEACDETREYVIDLSQADPGWISGYAALDELMFITTGTIWLDYVYITDSPFQEVSRTENIQRSVSAGEKMHIMITETACQALNTVNTYIVSYDPEMLSVTDLCAFTRTKDVQTSGFIPGTDLLVVSHVPGVLILRTTNTRTSYFKRLVDAIEFTALQQGLTSVSIQAGMEFNV